MQIYAKEQKEESEITQVFLEAFLVFTTKNPVLMTK